MNRLALFLLALSVYLLSMTGTLGIDEETMYLVTEAIAERGEVAVGPSMLTKTWTTTVRGREYSILEIGQSILALPFYYMGRLAAPHAPGPLQPYVTRGAVALLGPIAGASAVLLLALVVEALGHSRGRGVAVGLLAAFGTILWPYARTFYREPVLAALFLLVVWAILRYRADGRARWIAIASIAFAVAGTVRVLTIGLAPVFIAYIAGAERRRSETTAGTGGHKGRPCRGVVSLVAMFAIGTGVAGAIDLAYNAIRFGSPWSTGYPADERFGNPLLRGISGYLLSPGRSVFLYAPVLLIAMCGVRRMWREARGTLLLVAAVAAYHVCVYGCWWAWANGRGLWGPRYLVPAVPLMLLPAAWVRPGRAWKAILAISIAIQVLGVLTWGRFLLNPEKEKVDVELKSFDVHHSAVLSWDAWRSLGALRWDRAFPPGVARDPHSDIAHELKDTTAATWWALAWRAGFSAKWLLGAAFLALVAFGSGLALLKLRHSGIPRDDPRGSESQ